MVALFATAGAGGVGLEFTGQSLHAWWLAVCATAGVAMLLYTLLLLYEDHQARMAVARAHREDLGRGPAINLLRPIEPVRIFGIPAAFIAGPLGVAALASTAIMAVFGLPAGSLALLWTALLSVAAIGLFYQRVYRYLNRRRMASLFTLRVLGMLCLLVMLFQPVLGFTPQRENRRKLAVVVDASGSMSISDRPNEPNRYRQSVLAIHNTLLPRLADGFDTQIFAYDGKHAQALARPEELDQIAPNGTATDLSAAMGLGTSAGAEQVVLFSDGIHNGPTTWAANIDQFKVPIHTVQIGSSALEASTVPDIAVVSIDGPQTATVNNQLTLTAAIKSTALSDRTVKVLLMQGTTQLDEQRLVLRSGPTPQMVHLKFTPDKLGRTVVRVQVPVDPAERSAANNQQDFPMLVTDPKLAVLYVEGRVRPEVGPLRRALEQDPNINAISMVQVQAGKFTLSGVKEGDDLKGLPTTQAQWKRFKVIILGDLDASFLNAQQQKDLLEAVKAGTGLLMIGGQNSFAPGGWEKTVLADLLPVSLAKTDPAQINTAFVPQLTAAGGTHPIFRSIAGYFIGPDGKAPATKMPELSGCVALAAAKPAANILAVHPGARIGGQPAIVLAVQQYGPARTAAFAADTTWHWSLFLKAQGKDSPYNRFWGQMVRWLAGQEDLQKKSGPSVTAMIPKERYEAGEPVVLRCAVTDREGQATKFATVWADIKGPDNKLHRVDLSSIDDQIGVYEVVDKPTMAGAYAVTFHGTKDQGDLGKDASSFAVMQAAGEMETLAASPETMQGIARDTGGESVELANVEALVTRLASQAHPAGVGRKRIVPLYQNHAFFGLFVAALTLEWFLRRRWQLQ